VRAAAATPGRPPLPPPPFQVEDLRALCRDCAQPVPAPQDLTALRAAAVELLHEAIAQREAAAYRAGRRRPGSSAVRRGAGQGAAGAATGALGARGPLLQAGAASTPIAPAVSSSGSGSGTEATEQLLDDLFDDDLQQRLSAAAAAGAAAGVPEAAGSSGVGGSSSSLQPSPTTASSSSTSGGGSVSTPGARGPQPAADPWAPLPSLQQDIAALPARIRAALMRRGHAAAAAAPGAVASLLLLGREELQAFLEEAGRPTRGGRELGRQDMAALLSAAMAQQQLQQQAADAAGDGEAAALLDAGSASGVLPGAAGDAAAGSSGGGAVGSGLAGAAHMHPRRREVLAAAAARQRLAEAVVDAREIGAWLLAAKMREVAVVEGSR